MTSEPVESTPSTASEQGTVESTLSSASEQGTGVVEDKITPSTAEGSTMTALEHDATAESRRSVLVGAIVGATLSIATLASVAFITALVIRRTKTRKKFVALSTNMLGLEASCAVNISTNCSYVPANNTSINSNEGEMNTCTSADMNDPNTYTNLAYGLMEKDGTLEKQYAYDYPRTVLAPIFKCTSYKT